MMVTAEDIAQLAISWWNASTAMRQLVPGGAWKDRVDENAESPYAVLAVTEGDPQWNSGPRYYQPFTFEVRVYGTVGGDGMRQIRRLASLLYGRDQTAGFRIPDVFSAIDLMYRPGESRIESQTTAGQDVSVAVGRWEALVQSSQA